MRGRALGLVAVLAVGGFMLRHVGEPPFGAHVFRQAHVAGNIEKYVAKGLSLRPETYNLDAPAALFDFPAYELLVAWLSRTFGTPPVATARVVNVTLFALALVALGRLLAASGLRGAPWIVGLASFALSPLNLFYWQVPLPDPLAVLASLVSLLAYVRWHRRPAAAPLAVLLASSVLATMIKNPVYLPSCVAILWHRARARGLRSLAAPAMLAFMAAVGGAVVLFKLYSNWVNQAGGFLTPEEADAYFGAPRERLRRKFWRLILASLSREALAPAALVLAVAGIALLLWRARRRRDALHAGLVLGCAASLMLFFSRHHEHDYYQLPFVAPLAIAAAHAARWALAQTRACGLRVAPRVALPAFVVAATLWTAAPGVRALYDRPIGEAASRGAWIQAHSRTDDFVAYVVGEVAGNWDPTHLYFAQRDGYNLARSEVTFAMLAELHRRFAGRYRRFLIFCPWPSLEEVDPRLRALGARLETEGDQGSLYQLEPSWLQPTP